MQSLPANLTVPRYALITATADLDLGKVKHVTLPCTFCYASYGVLRQSQCARCATLTGYTRPSTDTTQAWKALICDAAVK